MIIPIGAQNAYVLNQGIKRNHHLTTATICSVLDMIFISLGIFGGGAILSQNEILLTSVTLGGIAFLSFYGLLSLKSVFKPESESESKGEIVARGRRTVILGALAVTVLNPHLYLDTVVILGSIGGQFEGHDRIAFALGTIMASFVWFYTLSIGAAKLGPTLSKPKVKKTIDIAIAMMMFTIAYILASELIDKYW
ncbi:lysine efflux permease [Vibrio alginolyticus]|nr:MULTISPECIES: LysE/ArgO family amino acid transporter [Vibrio]AGV17519.1 LysE/YggA family protein [Vibrio alginolyticus NBRC 15630 = ATCC 17749]GAD73238.1 putative amino acid transporter [Vibrio alginolyticus NBRC 15630 = ATCC 17749]SQA44474.1 lysine efflux permease [Vibrio alginolyticus]